MGVTGAKNVLAERIDHVTAVPIHQRKKKTKFIFAAFSLTCPPDRRRQSQNPPTTTLNSASTLAPADTVEEVTAAEFVRSAWRLRRCAMAEESPGAQVARSTRNTDRPTSNPTLYATTCLPRTPSTAPAPLPRAVCAAPNNSNPVPQPQNPPAGREFIDRCTIAPVQQSQKAAWRLILSAYIGGSLLPLQSDATTPPSLMTKSENA